jgi:beta-phosphoglucomutase-like phosphatase (HAD superfamily)
MVKLIIFDLDGVLVDAKNIHYEALNKALGGDFEIKWNSRSCTDLRSPSWKSQGLPGGLGVLQGYTRETTVILRA